MNTNSIFVLGILFLWNSEVTLSLNKSTTLPPTPTIKSIPPVSFTNKTWNLAPSVGMIPAPRASPCLFFYDSFPHVMFGFSALQYYNDLWYFDPKEMRWKIQPTRAAPWNRAGPSCWLRGDQLWIYGGEDETVDGLQDLRVMNFQALTWEDVSAAGGPSPRFDMCTYVVNNSHVAFFGGVSPNGFLTDLWYLKTDPIMWIRSTISAPPSLKSKIVNATSLICGGFGLPYVYLTDARELWVLQDQGWALVWSPNTKSQSIQPNGLPEARVGAGGHSHPSTSGTTTTYFFMTAGRSSAQKTLLKDLWSFSTETMQWKLHSTAISPREIPEIIIETDLVVIYGGRNNGENDDIILYNITERKMTAPYSPGKYTFPAPRSFASVILWSDLAILFGGLQSSATALDDVWRFNFTEQNWYLMETIGTPGVRHSHAGFLRKHSYIIFGGCNARSSSYYDDMWDLYLISGEWTRIERGADDIEWPEGRCSSGYVKVDDTFYIYGGQRSDGIAADLWAYDVYFMKWKLISYLSPPGALFYPSMAGNTTSFILLGGSGIARYNPDIYFFSEASGWVNLVSWLPTSMSVAATVNSQQELHVVILPGEFNGGIFAANSTFYFQEKSGKPRALPVIAATSPGAAVLVAQQKIWIFFGLLALSNGDLNLENPSPLVWSLEPLLAAECSPGYVWNRKTCVLCPAGSYVVFGTWSCVPCPSGTYNPVPGGTSQQQCLPCPPNTFNSRAGMTSCEPCSETNICPISNVGNFIQFKNPKAFASLQLPQESYTVTHVFYYVFGGIAILWVIVFMVFYLLQQSLNWWSRFDLFFFMQWVPHRTGYVRTQITPLGGVVSGIAFLSSLLLYLGLTTPTIFNSHSPVISIVPDTLFKISARDYSLKLGLIGAEELCLSGGTCKSTISVSGEGYESLSPGTKDLSCEHSGDTCWVTWTCEMCQFGLKQDRASSDSPTFSHLTNIIFSFNDTETKASGMRWSLSVDNNDPVSGAIFPNDGGMLCGLTEPTRVNLFGSPAIFAKGLWNRQRESMGIFYRLSSSGSTLDTSKSFTCGIRAIVNVEILQRVFVQNEFDNVNPPLLAAYLFSAISGSVVFLQVLFRCGSKYMDKTSATAPQSRPAWRKFARAKNPLKPNAF